jgi:hypothetical protein
VVGGGGGGGGGGSLSVMVIIQFEMKEGGEGVLSKRSGCGCG